MERLVVKSKAGSLYYNYAEKGVKLEAHEITPHQRRLLLERLHAYEDTGLTPQEIMELKERDTAVNPISLDRCNMCRNCCERLMPIDRFCPNCGQRLKWEED